MALNALIGLALVAGARGPALEQGLPAPAGPGSIGQPGDAYIHMSNTLNLGGNSTYLENLALNGNPNARFLAINQLNPEGASAGRNDIPLSVWYNNSNQRWAIYNDDQTNMGKPLAWNVLIPPADGTLILHTTTLSNTAAGHTVISDTQLNGNPAAVIFAQHVYNPGGGLGTFFTDTVMVAYDYYQSKWTISTTDGGNIDVGRSFFVLKPSADYVAYQHITSSDNLHLVNRTTLDNPLINGNPNALIFVTQNYNTGPHSLANNHRIGVWYDVPCSCWSIFNEDLAAMSPGLMFNVLIIPPKAGFFVHTATAGNTQQNGTALDNPDLNDNPHALVYVTHNWDPPDFPGNILNDHPIGMQYHANRWHVYNRDNLGMPLGANFNVYYTWPRDNSFSVSASSTNTTGVRSMLLNSPLLNGRPGAVAIATYNNDPDGLPGPAYAQNSGLAYDNLRLASQIFNNTGSPFPPGLSYNVLVPPTDSFTHTATPINTNMNRTVINDLLTNGDPRAMLFVSPLEHGGLNQNNLGVSYVAGQWGIFNENGAAMTAGSAYNVFVTKRLNVFLPLLIK